MRAAPGAEADPTSFRSVLASAGLQSAVVGSVVATILAGIVFKGLVLRVPTQMVATAALSFIRVIAPFEVLDFGIIAPKQIMGGPIAAKGEMFPAQSAPAQHQQQGFVI